MDTNAIFKVKKYVTTSTWDEEQPDYRKSLPANAIKDNVEFLRSKQKLYR